MDSGTIFNLEFIVEVGSKNRIVIPKQVAELAKLEEGDKVKLVLVMRFVKEEGRIVQYE